jgi:hypothetical protein
MGAAVTMGAEEAEPVFTMFGKELAASVYGLTNSTGYVFPLLIGSMALTTEFRHKTITQSLLVEPRRSVLLGAKIVATVPVGLLYGLVGTLAMVGASAPFLALGGDGAYLSDPDVIKVLVFSVVVIMLWAMIGVAFGSVVPNQVAAIVVILALTQLVEPIARAVLASFDATEGVSRFLPGAAADGLIGSSLFTQMMGGSSDLLARPAAFAVLLGYAIILALIGRYTTLRRDIG